MTGRRDAAERPPDPGEAGADESGLSIARSNALVPLLVMFAATVLGTLVIIVRAEPPVPPEGSAAAHAYRPADFPKVFGRDESLSGIERGVAGRTTALYPVPAPPFSEGIFPCSECHADLTPNPKRRPLTMAHDDVALRHDEENRWCLDCHDAASRDHLRLASGALVPFTESYRLCGQCHGTQYRDWRSGIHGKRTGYWDGPKRYLLCVHCHDPHRPRHGGQGPLPPPVRPQFLGKEAPARAEVGHGPTGR